MQKDNLFMIEEVTDVEVIGTVSTNAENIDYLCDPIKLYFGDE